MSNRGWWGVVSTLIAALVVVSVVPRGALPAGHSVQAGAAQAALNVALGDERDRLAALVAAGCTSGDLRATGDALNAYRNKPSMIASQGIMQVDGKVRAPEQLVAMLDAAVVLIVSEHAHGSGFFVAPDLIVTNSHVVEAAGADGVWITSRILGKITRAKVVATTPSSNIGGPDFALLRLPGQVGGVALAIADDATRLAPVVAAGYPGLVLRTDPRLARLLSGQAGEAPETVLSPGEVSVTQPQENGTKLVIHTADISPGNSGGPLVDRCGRVVAVNTFVSKSADYGGRVLYALSAADLTTFLRANGASFTASAEHCASGGSVEKAAHHHATCRRRYSWRLRPVSA